MMWLKGKFPFLSILSAFLLLFSGPLIAKEPVVFADLSWESIQLHNRIAGFIFTHGYDEKVDYLFVDLTAGLMGIERGDIDINMELWPTVNLDWWDKARAKKTVVDLGINFDGASQGWYVPTYVIKGDPKRR
ncbi:MAG: ABC transporter substrate-binding protein, partial [Synergistaceae bacterium]|nr:ABC transporter substrate-binding protein [Synergistaceae bacterium]